MLLKHILHKSAELNRVLCLLAVVIAMGGCGGSAPTKPKQTGIHYGNYSTEALVGAITQAQKQASPERENALMTIAQGLLDANEVEQATKVIDLVNSRRLGDDNYPRYVLIASRIHLQSQSLFKARSLLASTRLDALLDQLSIKDQQQLHRLRAQLYRQTGEMANGLNERIVLGTLLSNTEDIQENNDRIWQQLSSLTYAELLELSLAVSDPVLRSWFDLAIVSNQAQGSLESQNNAIVSWIADHPNHPASEHLPVDLALLQKLIQTRPNNIALLLPLQGKLAKAGHAIRDGFLAAFYRSYNEQQSPPLVTFYDTSTGDINHLYNQAVNNGANIVIGPLAKKNVQALQQRESLPVTTLALNYLETSDNKQSTKTNKPLYQFGLSLEDEAVQVAERAWLEGHRQALILSSDTSWSQRAADAFVERWQAYGGTVVTDSHLRTSESYSDKIKSILHIDQSRQRAITLKRLFGQNFEFEPRRRADIDMIFLIARSQEGRQIKPTLNFHYAGDIPVYSTSQIYAQGNSKNKNRDLNQIRLTTLPWVLNNDIAEKALIDKHISINQGYERLYALGVDSFLLYPRLQQLYLLRNQQLYGVTGKLSITQDKRITRQQLWATIVGGELQPLRVLNLSGKSDL